MRITNGMMVNTLRSNITRNMRDMDKMQSQLSSGKRISKPSDDPVGVGYSLRLRNNLVENEQYTNNVNDGLSFLDATESAVEEVGDVLKRIKELTIQGANDTNSIEAKMAISNEVRELKNHLISVANTEFAGKYIFSGTASNIPTYLTNGTWQAVNTTTVNFEVGVATKVPVNITADQFFEDLPGANLFATLQQLETDLNTPGSNISAHMPIIDKWLDKTNAVRTEVGARVNRLEFTKARLEDNNLNFTDLLSKTEDADMAQLITQFKVQESVYRASLASGARIVQPSLIDFLR
jgi:flagellar hook-associated protein 3 FlgL